MSTANRRPDPGFLGDRIPPNNLEAERVVLSAMMQEPESAEIAFEGLLPEDFYHAAHRRLFELMVKLYGEGRIFDWFTLKNEAATADLLESLGGEAGFLDLMNAAPTAAMIDEYAHIVKERSIQRAAVSVASRTLKTAYSPAVPITELLDNMECGVQEIAERFQKSRVESIGDLLGRTLEEMERARAGGEWKEDVVPTGYPDLDELLAGGFHRGELILLAARPSVGKTTMALNLIRKISVHPPEVKPLPALLFSLEMPAQVIADHILCADAGIPGNWVRRRLTGIQGDELGEHGYDDIDELFGSLMAARDKISAAPVFLDDGGALSIIELRSKARRHVAHNGIQVIFIDYIQLMDMPRAENRNLQITMLSGTLKNLARELKIPIIALSQLRRPREEHASKRPIISDLRESGSLEQDADVILLLHREDYQAHRDEHKEEDYKKQPPPLEVIVGKNRNGAPGKVKMTFMKEQFRIEPYFPESQSF